MLTNHKTFTSFDKHAITVGNEGRFIKYVLLEKISRPHKTFSFTNKLPNYTKFYSGFTKGTGIMTFNATTWQDYEYVR